MALQPKYDADCYEKCWKPQIRNAYRMPAPAQQLVKWQFRFASLCPTWRKIKRANHEAAYPSIEPGRKEAILIVKKHDCKDRYPLKNINSHIALMLNRFCPLFVDKILFFHMNLTGSSLTITKTTTIHRITISIIFWAVYSLKSAFFWLFCLCENTAKNTQLCVLLLILMFSFSPILKPFLRATLILGVHVNLHV